MIYEEIYTEVANRLGDTNDQTMISNAKRWVNQKYQEVIRKMMSFTDVEYLTQRGTFTPNSDSTYTFPAYVGNITDIKNTTQRLKKVRVIDLDTVFPNPNGGGTPYWWYSLGTTPVYQQPSVASYLSCASSSSSDLTQEVTVRGLLNGIERYETITLSGTNSVSTVNQFDHIYTISKSVSTNGVVTAIVNSGTLSASILAPQVLENQYQKIGIYPLNTSTQHTYTYQPYVLDMLSDNDVPYIPPQFHYILIDGAEAIGRRWLEDFDIARECDLRFLSGIEELKSFVKNSNQYEMSFTQGGGNPNTWFSPYTDDNFMA